MSRTNISTLIAIAEKAIEVTQLEDETRKAAGPLRDACRDFRMRHNQGNYVPLHTDLHEQMCQATAREFSAYDDARRAVRNAKRRLDTAVRAHLKEQAR